MPALFVFLLKVNIALIIFCLGYYLVLRKLTFYTLNRVYLGVGIIFSSVYPLINIDAFMQRHQQLAIPVQKVILNWKAPAEQFIQQPGYWYWATVIFWLGAAVFAVRLLVQLFSLYKLYRNSRPGKMQDHEVRITDANISPFSFWQSIYINPNNLDAADLHSILQHEQVHVKEWHTLDILLAEVSVIFYWFNPGVWLMKKAVRENIEFITDRKILQQGMDSKAYQYSLLNVSIAETASAGIINHFNFSTLKKRIKMMNAKRSSKINLTRYAFLLPVVLVCLFAFSLSKAEIVKKSKVTYKTLLVSLDNMVKTANVAIEKQDKKLFAKPVADTTKPKKTTQNFVVHYSYDTDSDTGKRTSLKMVRINDSTSYYVNGKKVTADEYKKVSPGDIQTIDLADNPNAISSVHIVTRKDTDKTNRPFTVRKDGEHNLIVTFDTKNDTTKLKTDGFVNISGYGSTGDKKMVMIKGSSVKGTVQNVMITNRKTETSIDNLADKLIVVDGKVVDANDKAWKKLPASDILTINVKEGSEMTDQYGDKAKNGVMFINTKKGKK